MNFGGGLQDQMLKTYIDQIFDKYDADRSGTLDEQEMTLFFNDLFKSLGMNISVTEEQSLEAIRSIDQNFDGGVDKKELFDAFKLMMTNNKPNNQPPPPPNGYNYPNQMSQGGQGYNPYQPQNPYNQPDPFAQQPNPYQQNPYGQQNPYMQNQYNQQNPYMQQPNPYGQQNPYGPQNPYGQNGYNGYMGGSNFGGGWGRRTR